MRNPLTSTSRANGVVAVVVLDAGVGELPAVGDGLMSDTVDASTGALASVGALPVRKKFTTTRIVAATATALSTQDGKTRFGSTTASGFSVCTRLCALTGSGFAKGKSRIAAGLLASCGG